MAIYKFSKDDFTQFVNAENKSKARKVFCKDQGWEIEKVDGEDDFDESIYWQQSPRYDGWTLGNSDTSMQIYGCALMCWSYVSRRDPKDVDKLFVDEKVYNHDGQGDSIIFSKAAEVLGLDNYFKDENINNMPEQRETIKEVQLGRSQHFVVRFNIQGKRDIFDPWTGEHQEINYYPFLSYRVFDK